MKNISLVLILLFVIYSPLFSQEIEWMTSGAGNGSVRVILNGNDQQASSIVESNGNVYVSGLITGREGSATIQEIELDSIYYAGFLVKYDKQGKVKWVKTLPNHSPNFVDVDKQGNVYVVGKNLSNKEGILLQKYDSTGTLLWEKITLENTSFAIPYSLVVDNEDNMIIAGRYFKISSSFNIEDSLVTGINGDAIQGFIVKFNADGNFKWFRTTNTSIKIFSSYCQLNGIDVDQSDNIFFIGKVYLSENDTLFFDSQLYATSNNQNRDDVIIGKINKDGRFQWIRKFGSTSNDTGNKIRVTTQGDLYFTGAFGGELIVEDIIIKSKGRYDFFCGKLSAENNLEWIRMAGSVGDDAGHAVDIDSEGNVYFGGYLNPGTTFYEEADSIQLLSLNDFYNEGISFLAKYDHSGHLVWVLNGNLTSSNILDIHIDQDNKLYFAGYFFYGARFNDTPIPVTNRNGSNFFVGSMLLNTVTGLEQEYKTDEVTLYPNPSQGVVDIIVPQMAFETWSYKLYDLQGNIVKDETIFFKDKITLDFSNLSTGIYTLVLIQDKKYFFKRIVIEH